ncbi:hypothetical protein H5410_026784 [Solanum commersonii]|uniref:Bulb-type lectin domain-containing protein n=1 Tax=Solanum commersonii TaxID=4109 RepID=A0A9J5Z1M4_SOLCO|nr:hypothetical protein H5410_026784 [Solanum commersonii]
MKDKIINMVVLDKVFKLLLAMSKLTNRDMSKLTNQMKLTKAKYLLEATKKMLQTEQSNAKIEPKIQENNNIYNTSSASLTIHRRNHSQKAENPHIKRGIKGFVEFPKVVRAISSKSRHWGTNVILYGSSKHTITDPIAFGYYKQTNGYAIGSSIVGMPKKTTVWTANKNTHIVPSNVVLLLTSDGRLTMQVDRNVIWQSFDNPINTNLPGQHISAGEELFLSASEADDLFRIFCLKMQNDRNLVQYLVDTTNSTQYAYYATDLHNSTNRLRNLTRGGYVEK